MKWKDKPKPKIGDTRTRSWFAFLPVKITGETRWLEWVVVEEEVKSEMAHDPSWLFPYYERHWVKQGFVKRHKECHK